MGPDLRSLETDFRAWDLARWEDATTHQFLDDPYPDGSALVPGVSGQPFMSPYPASTFKLLVAVQVLRQVDAGRLWLTEQTVNLAPARRESRAKPSTQGAEPTVAEALDAMITSSDNSATCLLLQQLHVLHQLEPGSNELNRTFASWVWPRCRSTAPTRQPVPGGGWAVSTWPPWTPLVCCCSCKAAACRFANTAGWGPSELLTTPSRQRLLSLLEQQGFHDVLSTTNWCGRSYPGAGIPARVPARWIGADGTVTVGEIP